MLKRFVPLKSKGLGCLESCYINLLHFLGMDYPLAFYNFLDFEYRRSPTLKTIGERLYFGAIMDMEIFTKFYGLKLTEIFGSDQAWLQMNESLEWEIPFILHTNTKDCPWLKEFSRLELSHFMIVYRYEAGRYFCVDPMVETPLIFLAENQLGEMLVSVNLFHQMSLPKLNLEDVLLDSASILENRHLENDFNALRSDFDQLENLELEYTFQRGLPAPIDSKLGFNMSGRRELYAQFLAFIDHKLNIPLLQEIRLDCQELRKLWLNLRNILAKSFSSNSYNRMKPKVLDLIYKISAMEIRNRKHLIEVKERIYMNRKGQFDD